MRFVRLLGLSLATTCALAAAASAATLCVNPTGSGNCHDSIQAAIDDAQPGDVINVYPGNYEEATTNRTVLDGTPLANGPHQFGLFIGQDKPNLTIQGVDAKGKPVRSWKKVLAHVTTDATNDFGPSGVFVEGDGVTIAGLDIGINNFGQNKTIEVIGDDFVLESCDITDVYGSLYFGDWRFDTNTNTSHIRSYAIDGNNFRDGVSIDITNGAGFTGPVSSRQITGNVFANQYYWPSVSFTGSNTGVPWFVYSVGGAEIEGNVFVNTFAYDPSSPDWDDLYLRTSGHIRARGDYDNAQFDWATWFRKNSFNQAYATGPRPPQQLRAYTYPGSYGTYENVRRIGVILQGEQDIAEPGDRTVSAH